MRAFFIGILAVALGLVGLGLFVTRSTLSGANESPVAASSTASLDGSRLRYSLGEAPPSTKARGDVSRDGAQAPPPPPGKKSDAPARPAAAPADDFAPPEAPAPIEEEIEEEEAQAFDAKVARNQKAAERERRPKKKPKPRKKRELKKKRLQPVSEKAALEQDEAKRAQTIHEVARQKAARREAARREVAKEGAEAVRPTDRLSDLLTNKKRRASGEEGALGYRDAQRMPAAIDLGLLSTGAKTARIDATRPERFLPRMCYFENTYLGGNAAYQEQLRRVQTALGHTRPLRLARLDAQAFDAPLDAGMALTASLDTTGLQQPGRVVLQVGLQGSQRYGWRRPPLDVVLVIDGPAAHATRPAIDALLGALGPRDRLGVIRAGEAPLTAVTGMRAARDALLDVPAYPGGGGSAALQTAMDRAGRLLRAAAGQSARIPGSQTVILLTQGQQDHARRATQAAHALQTQGAVVSVIDLSADTQAEWWAVANAGHGNFHRTPLADLNTAVDAELASLAKVVARLLRVNVRLGPQAEGIRVIGSRVLEQAEVKAVKAREEATDRNLSKTMGLKADRGADDDGIQTVIPYFYGGDSQVDRKSVV